MFKYIQQLIDKLKVSEKGQGMVEYALIIAFVAAIAIFALNGKLKDSVGSAFEKAASQVTDAGTKSDEIKNSDNSDNSGGN